MNIFFLSINIRMMFGTKLNTQCLERRKALAEIDVQGKFFVFYFHQKNILTTKNINRSVLCTLNCTCLEFCLVLVFDTKFSCALYNVFQMSMKSLVVFHYPVHV